ncbi:MAG: hypothetical protein Ct9H300mP28_18750 [Pseudomonadota bacterium]|nr:MAG: hypothetical protein Ct9H300mP28_18750 [Pseudomonadota bacterium]
MFIILPAEHLPLGNKERRHTVFGVPLKVPEVQFKYQTIRAGELDMGVAQSDWQYHSYRGTSKFKDKAFKDYVRFFRSS